MSKLIFDCPDCHSNDLELITTNCIVITPITLHEHSTQPVYGEDEVLDGDFDMIQCGSCGYIIQDNGHNVDEDEIRDWVKNQIKESICTKK